MAVGAHTVNLATLESVRGYFSGVNTGFRSTVTGYMNSDGGWVEAAAAMKILYSKVTKAGAEVLLGKTVSKLTKEGEVTNGVECADGSSYPADVVVLALGSWIASAFPELKLESHCLATAYASLRSLPRDTANSRRRCRQSIITIQLTPEEAETYRKCPVYLDLNTGFYIFPVSP